MNGGQIAEVVVRHHLIWADVEATCLCGWNDLVSLFGYHILRELLDFETALDAGETSWYWWRELDRDSANAKSPVVKEPAPIVQEEPQGPVEEQPLVNPAQELTTEIPIERETGEEPVAPKRAYSKRVGQHRGRYDKEPPDEDVADYYETHTRDQTAHFFGISPATVVRKVRRFEEDTGTLRRQGVAPRTPLKVVDLPAVERAPDPPLPANDFEERRKAAAREATERTWAQRRGGLPA